MEGLKTRTTTKNFTPSRRIISYISTIIVFATIAALPLPLANADDIYLIIGQSNACGRDTNIDHLGLDAPDPNVRILTQNNNDTEIAVQPLNDYSIIKKSTVAQGVNLGLEFGKQMNAHTGNPILLVVNCRGGTSINQWRRGRLDTGFFEKSVTRVRAAESLMAENGDNNKLKGILWHQGESDKRQATSYFDKLIDLIKEFREELGAGDVPFLCGQLLQKDSTQVFNGIIQLVGANYFPLPNVDWVSSTGLTSYDGTHFDANSTRELGRRYAETMMQFI